MGLRSSIQAAVNSAIVSGVGDLNSTITFKSVVQGTYDPVTGNVPQGTTSYSCTCVLTNLKQQDVTDMSIVATGRKALVPALQLTGVNVDALDDTVTVGSVVYNIFSFSLDPSGSLYTFILKTSG